MVYTPPPQTNTADHVVVAQYSSAQSESDSTQSKAGAGFTEVSGEGMNVKVDMPKDGKGTVRVYKMHLRTKHGHFKKVVNFGQEQQGQQKGVQQGSDKGC